LAGPDQCNLLTRHETCRPSSGGIVADQPLRKCFDRKDSNPRSFETIQQKTEALSSQPFDLNAGQAANFASPAGEKMSLINGLR